MFKWLNQYNHRFSHGAAILSATAFLSYGLGLVRDRLFAHTFGAGSELDAYNAAFIIPDLLLNILVAGALQAAFIPIFTDIWHKKGKDEAEKLANTVLNAGIIAVIIIGTLAAIFMPALTKIIAPGFAPHEKALLINLTRLLLLSPIIFSISNTLGAILVSQKSYFAYGLSPVFYNFGIIAGVLLLSRTHGIYGVVFGTLAGALLHLGIRILGMRPLKLKYAPILNWRDYNFKRIVVLMIPKMFGHPAEQLIFWAFTVIASTLAAGSITMLSFARNFMSVPVSLFGIAFATASFPILSQAASRADHREFVSHFWESAKKTLLFTVPSGIILFFFSVIIVKIFLGSGKFDDHAIFTTASVLSIFALSVPTESLSHLLARSFYALQDTLMPVIFSLLGFGIAIAIGFAYAPALGLPALAWGFFAGSVFKITSLGILLFKRTKNLR